MPTWVETAFKWFGEHLSPRYASVVAILTGFLLFASDNVLASFGVEDFAHTYRGVIFLFFGFSVILLATYPVSSAWNAAGKSLAKYKHRRSIKEHLENLGSDEIVVLLQYVQSGRNSIHFGPENGSVQGLVYKGILYRPEQRMNGEGEFAYNVTPAAAKLIHHNKFQEVLDKITKRGAKRV